jgi:DNA-binding NarL/FixJ family response regulator
LLPGAKAHPKGLLTNQKVKLFFIKIFLPATGMMPILISIYENNDTQRTLLEMLIGSTPGFELTGVYPNCSSIFRDIRVHRPDVIVLDIDGLEPDAIEGIRIIKDYDSAIRVLIQTNSEDDERLFECLRSGADGYLLKKDMSQRLIRAIGELYDGGCPLSPGIARKVLQTFYRPRAVPENLYSITPREKEVLSSLANGYTYRMIGLHYSISTETVRRHLKNIYQKMQVRGGHEAIAKAMRENIIKL